VKDTGPALKVVFKMPGGSVGRGAVGAPLVGTHAGEEEASEDDDDDDTFKVEYTEAGAIEASEEEVEEEEEEEEDSEADEEYAP
jgi:hypothetical protein